MVATTDVLGVGRHSESDEFFCLRRVCDGTVALDEITSGPTWVRPLPDRARPPRLVGRWRHFKGGEYRFLGVASRMNGDETEDHVVYLDAVDAVWVRPSAMIDDRVVRDDYNGPRFVRVSD